MARMIVPGWGWGIATAIAACLAGPAKAEGFPPFYGYSTYIGGPAVYYTRHPDVQQTTRPVAGELGFGVRTYTTGGPFYHYRPTRARGFPVRRQREVVRVRG